MIACKEHAGAHPVKGHQELGNSALQLRILLIAKVLQSLDICFGAAAAA